MVNPSQAAWSCFVQLNSMPPPIKAVKLMADMMRARLAKYVPRVSGSRRSIIKLFQAGMEKCPTTTRGQRRQ